YGTFNVTNAIDSIHIPNTIEFAAWASTRIGTALVGDFNGDGRADIALVGGPGWTTLPMAFSNGDGNFGVTNNSASQFEYWPSQPGVTVLVGDFNGDGKADIALVGGAGLYPTPVAFSNGDGIFNIPNHNTS